MSTLISTHNSNGETGRCDAKCYNATKPECKCCCGGANHGVGYQQAVKNVENIVKNIIAQGDENLKVKYQELAATLF